MTILVAEDNLEYGKVVAEALSLSGHHVLTAANGKEAFEVLQRCQVDLIIADVNMPTCSGTQLHEMVRADKRLHAIPFIYMTGNTILRLATPLDKRGLDFMVGKVPFDGLMQVIGGLCHT